MASRTKGRAAGLGPVVRCRSRLRCRTLRPPVAATPRRACAGTGLWDGLELATTRAPDHPLVLRRRGPGWRCRGARFSQVRCSRALSPLRPRSSPGPGAQSSPPRARRASGCSLTGTTEASSPSRGPPKGPVLVSRWGKARTQESRGHLKGASDPNGARYPANQLVSSVFNVG